MVKLWNKNTLNAPIYTLSFVMIQILRYKKQYWNWALLSDMIISCHDHDHTIIRHLTVNIVNFGVSRLFCFDKPALAYMYVSVDNF